MLRHSVQLLCLELVILWAVPKEWISGTLGFWPAKWPMTNSSPDILIFLIWHPRYIATYPINGCNIIGYLYSENSICKEDFTGRDQVWPVPRPILWVISAWLYPDGNMHSKRLVCFFYPLYPTSSLRLQYILMSPLMSHYISNWDVEYIPLSQFRQ